LVWQFDLERNHSFTVAMQGEEGDWELGVTSPKGEFYPVVHFQAREDAEDGFAAVQKILMKKKRSVMWRVFKVLAWILVFVVLLAAGIGFMISRTASQMSSMSSFMPLAGAPAKPAETPWVYQSLRTMCSRHRVEVLSSVFLSRPPTPRGFGATCARPRRSFSKVDRGEENP